MKERNWIKKGQKQRLKGQNTEKKKKKERKGKNKELREE